MLRRETSRLLASTSVNVRFVNRRAKAIDINFSSDQPPPVLFIEGALYFVRNIAYNFSCEALRRVMLLPQGRNRFEGHKSAHCLVDCYGVSGYSSAFNTSGQQLSDAIRLPWTHFLD